MESKLTFGKLCRLVPEYVCSVRVLVVVCPILLLLLEVVGVGLVGHFLSMVALQQTNEMKANLLLHHMEKMSDDYFSFTKGLAYDYRQRLMRYEGAFDLYDPTYLEFSLQHAHEILSHVVSEVNLEFRLYQSDPTGNLWNFLQAPAVPGRYYLRFLNVTNTTKGRMLQMSQTPIRVNETSLFDTAYLNESETLPFKPKYSNKFKPFHTKVFGTDMLPNETISTENFCPDGLIFQMWALRFYDEHGEFIGIVGAAIGIADLSVFLEDVVLEDGATMILINGDTHHLISSNLPDSIPGLDYSGMMPKMIHAAEHPYELLGTIYAKVLADTNHFSLSVFEAYGESQSFEMGGKIVNVDEAHLSDVNVLGIALVDKEIVYRLSNRMSLILVAVYSVGFVVLALLMGSLGCCVAVPVSKLKSLKEMNFTSSDDKESWGFSRSRFSFLLEIRQVQRAVNFLVDKVRFYKEFLPAELRQDDADRGGSTSEILTDDEFLMASLSDKNSSSCSSTNVNLSEDLEGAILTRESEGDHLSDSSVSECASVPSDFTGTSSDREDVRQRRGRWKGKRRIYPARGQKSENRVRDLRRQIGHLTLYPSSTVACLKLSFATSTTEESISSRNIALGQFLDVIKTCLRFSRTGSKFRGKIIEFTPQYEVFVAWIPDLAKQGGFGRQSPMQTETFCISAAQWLIEFLRRRGRTQSKDNSSSDVVNFHCGMCVGDLCVSTLGCQSLKKRVYGGDSMDVARSYAQMAEGFDLPLLCGETVYDVLKLHSRSHKHEVQRFYFVVTLFDFVLWVQNETRRTKEGQRQVTGVYVPELIEQPSNREWHYVEPIDSMGKQRKRFERMAREAFFRGLEFESEGEDANSSNSMGHRSIVDFMKHQEHLTNHGPSSIADADIVAGKSLARMKRTCDLLQQFGKDIAVIEDVHFNTVEVGILEEGEGVKKEVGVVVGDVDARVGAYQMRLEKYLGRLVDAAKEDQCWLFRTNGGMKLMLRNESFPFDN